MYHWPHLYRPWIYRKLGHIALLYLVPAVFNRKSYYSALALLKGHLCYIIFELGLVIYYGKVLAVSLWKKNQTRFLGNSLCYLSYIINTMRSIGAVLGVTHCHIGGSVRSHAFQGSLRIHWSHLEHLFAPCNSVRSSFFRELTQ